MKGALLIVLALAAVAAAGPAINKNQNQIDQQNANKAYMTATGDLKQTQATETLKQWCFSSQMSQPELTASFKKLVSIVKSSPEDQSTEAAVMSERICQGALVQKSAQTGETVANTGADAKAHELIKDVYMDALIACETRQCMQQLIKIINTNQVDTIRASYYMTRIAVTEKDQIKDDADVKQLAESFISQQQQPASEAIERQRLFAVTSMLGKQLEKKGEHQQQISGELKQIAEQVAKTIVERYIKPVSQQEVEQYKQQEQPSSQVAKKIAKRNAALKALANIPGFVLKEIKSVEQAIYELVENKQELVTVRQSAIECLEQNDQYQMELKKIAFAQEEPIEVRVAAYRAWMTTVFAVAGKNQQQQQQQASQIIEEIIKHCEEERNQQQDDQFVLYAISHLDNLRTSQQPEYQAIKETISKNKQHYMQIQLLFKKFQQELNDIRKSSRNYKLEQEFNQLESGLIIEGDLIYESKHQQNKQQQQQPQILPKLIRVNMSMPVMGETVNVVEITLRQNQMDEELLSTLKLVQGAKFNSESVSKVVGSFKSSVEQQQSRNTNKQVAAEADLTIKVEGCTIVYLCVDDFKSTTHHQQQQQHQRNARSVYSSGSIVDEIVEYLKRQPVAFNRGFNFNIDQTLAKVLDVDANIIAGLRFESRATGQSSKDFEIVAKVEPRFAFEAIVGPAKMSAKKLLQRVSTKTALGLRLRFKQNELVDVQVDLPMNTMELFTFETQMVEKSATTPYSYTYLPESIYGQEDIYSADNFDNTDVEDRYTTTSTSSSAFRGLRKMKRSIFEKNSSSNKSIVKKLMSSTSSAGAMQQVFAHELETPIEWARATGLRSKLRVVASPKDMSFLVECVAQKYEPRMQGYRVQVQQGKRSADLQQYIFSISTPGSTIDRTMQVRVVKQQTGQRFALKSDIQSPLVSASAQYELIHDGRQYAVKAEIAATRVAGAQKQWRHKFESGVQRAQSGQSARAVATYKPYLSLESTSLKRPVSMQGVVSYQTSPKSVISYELKCSTTGDFVQGKIILDNTASPAGATINRRQQQQNTRRSMQSPIEQLLRNDLTLTQEFVAQIEEHAVKVHQMIEWDCNKWALQADLTASHKNLRKQSSESQLVAKLQVEKDQQMFSCQRKCASPQEERKDFRFALNANNKQQGVHQLAAELRYSAGLKEIVAYKHKVDYSAATKSWRQAEVSYAVELLASEQKLNEKITGRTHLQVEPKMKIVRSEMSTASGKAAKLNVEFASLEQHLIEMQFQSPELKHRTSQRADKRQFSLQSRTEQRQQMLAKLVLDILKREGECQLIVEMPTKRTHVAADLKLASGKLSTVAIQTPRFATKAEFAIDTAAAGTTGTGSRHYIPAFYGKSPIGGLRFKSDLKDMIKQEQYWIDSAFNNDAATQEEKQSYLRFSSPAYRTDLEFSPRDQSAKWGLFARSKRSVGLYEPLYSTEESILNTNTNTNDNKLNLDSNKLWMMRSLISKSPSAVDSWKRQARRALFEYADRRQSQKHSFDWQPAEERVQYGFERQPSAIYQQHQQQSMSVKPISFSADLDTDFFNTFYSTKQQQQQQQHQKLNKKPSTLSMESELIDFDAEAKPFDGELSYAKLSALSRSPRSAGFKKHDSEIRYQKQHGYKAWMKHEDNKDRRHSWQLEADESPKKWAKMTYESDKHGKAKYEHQWRKHASKRQHKSADNKQDDEEIYQNKIAFERQSPNNKWAHSSQLSWDEPIKMAGQQQRYRRDLFSRQSSEDNKRRYANTIDYLKSINAARLQSQTSRDQAELYNLDFDYQPESYARLNIQMPEEMQHSSSFEYQPNERTYKLQSRHYNRRSQQPVYELMASTKPMIMGLASAEQEPMFFAEQHPMMERSSYLSSLFKSPMKLDYTDKYGRVANFDFDHSPLAAAASGSIYEGLRQKRASVFYKDSGRDFEHQSSYDFYPEAVLGFKQAKRVPGDIHMRADTKYGPISVHVDSDDKNAEIVVKSPVFKAQMTAETSPVSKRMALVKLSVDNKQQSVKLAKIVRQTPVLRECQIAKDLAEAIDQNRFEHQCELLINVVDSILKVKSQTLMNERQVMTVEGEVNQAANKAVFKINGERVYGQMLVDLVTKSANLSLEVDNKRTLQHQTRLVRVNDKFFSLDSMTSYKEQPLFKLTGKVSSMILSEPQHLFSSRRSDKSMQSREEHISTFDATIYEPKELQVSGQYDCLKKEARVIFKDVETNKVQKSFIKYDDETDSILVDARLSSPYGQVYSSQAKLSLPGLFDQRSCSRQSCQSEVVYDSQKDGSWAAKYYPGERFFVQTPTSKQNFNIAY